MNVIEVDHLTKIFRIPHERRSSIFETLTGVFKPIQYETFPALKDVTFTVEEGEMLGVIGENGSGKTTLLKIIAQIMRPSSGSVRVNQRLTPFLELGVGFHPDFTAVENIQIYGTIMGLSKEAITDKTDGILEFAGLEKFRDTKLKNFSFGMYVRLAFSTAIQTDPEILLLDEVLAVGDLEFQQKCMDALTRYRDKGVTIVFVSHDLGSIRRFCDRALLLRHGEQVALGETSEVIDQYVYGRPVHSPEARTDLPTSSDTVTSKENLRDGRVEITDVKFFNKFGMESNLFNTFDAMVIRIFYRANEMVCRPAFSLAIYTEKGENLYGTNTVVKNRHLDSIKGAGHIDLQVDSIPMFSGKFKITVAVYSHNGEPYDWADKKYSFDVITTGQYSGLFDVPCRWLP